MESKVKCFTTSNFVKLGFEVKPGKIARFLNLPKINFWEVRGNFVQSLAKRKKGCLILMQLLLFLPQPFPVNVLLLLLAIPITRRFFTLALILPRPPVLTIFPLLRGEVCLRPVHSLYHPRHSSVGNCARDHALDIRLSYVRQLGMVRLGPLEIVNSLELRPNDAPGGRPHQPLRQIVVLTILVPEHESVLVQLLPNPPVEKVPRAQRKRHLPAAVDYVVVGGEFLLGPAWEGRGVVAILVLVLQRVLVRREGVAVGGWGWG